MLSLRKYGKNPFVFEIYHSSMCTVVLLFPQPPEIFSLFSFFLNLQLLFVHQSSGNPSPLHSYRINSKMLPQANGWELFLTICWGFLSQKCNTNIAI